jgi:Cu/Ag efflux protein CusF
MFSRPGGTVKKIALALVVALAAAGAANAQTSKKAPSKAAAPASPVAKATPMKMEVVSVDATAKTITVKDATGSSKTLTATGGAIPALSKVKAGDSVMVTAIDTTATKIVAVKEPKAPAAPKKK